MSIKDIDAGAAKKLNTAVRETIRRLKAVASRAEKEPLGTALWDSLLEEQGNQTPARLRQNAKDFSDGLESLVQFGKEFPAYCRQLKAINSGDKKMANALCLTTDLYAITPTIERSMTVVAQKLRKWTHEVKAKRIGAHSTSKRLMAVSEESDYYKRKVVRLRKGEDELLKKYAAEWFMPLLDGIIADERDNPVLPEYARMAFDTTTRRTDEYSDKCSEELFNVLNSKSLGDYLLTAFRDPSVDHENDTRFDRRSATILRIIHRKKEQLEALTDGLDDRTVALAVQTGEKVRPFLDTFEKHARELEQLFTSIHKLHEDVARSGYADMQADVAKLGASIFQSAKSGSLDALATDVSRLERSLEERKECEEKKKRLLITCDSLSKLPGLDDWPVLKRELAAMVDQINGTKDLRAAEELGSRLSTFKKEAEGAAAFGEEVLEIFDSIGKDMTPYKTTRLGLIEKTLGVLGLDGKANALRREFDALRAGTLKAFGTEKPDAVEREFGSKVKALDERIDNFYFAAGQLMKLWDLLKKYELPAADIRPIGGHLVRLLKEEEFKELYASLTLLFRVIHYYQKLDGRKLVEEMAAGRLSGARAAVERVETVVEKAEESRRALLRKWAKLRETTSEFQFISAFNHILQYVSESDLSELISEGKFSQRLVHHHGRLGVINAFKLLGFHITHWQKTAELVLDKDERTRLRHVVEYYCMLTDDMALFKRVTGR